MDTRLDRDPEAPRKRKETHPLPPSVTRARARKHTHKTERYQEGVERKSGNQEESERPSTLTPTEKDIELRNTQGGWDGEPKRHSKTETQQDRNSETHKARKRAPGRDAEVGRAPLPPGKHLPMQKLRELKMRSALLRRRNTGQKEKPMARRRTRHRVRARIMKPMLMWMRTGRRGGSAQGHPPNSSPLTALSNIPNKHPQTLAIDILEITPTALAKVTSLKPQNDSHSHKVHPAYP